MLEYFYNSSLSGTNIADQLNLKRCFFSKFRVVASISKRVWPGLCEKTRKHHEKGKLKNVYRILFGRRHFFLASTCTIPTGQQYCGPIAQSEHSSRNTTVNFCPFLTAICMKSRELMQLGTSFSTTTAVCIWTWTLGAVLVRTFTT